MRNRTTLQDIADALEVTKVTVSRALKGQTGVSQILREEVKRKALEMGYSRTSLHNIKQVYHFAFITPKRFFLRTEHFYTDIYYVLHRLCDKKKYKITLHVIDPKLENTGELPNNLLDNSLSGLFIGGEMAKEYLVRIGELKLPTVIIDYYSSSHNCSHVTVDNYYLGYKAAQHLIEKGHIKIGFIGQSNISSNVADRMMGIQKALNEHNSSLKKEWIIENHDPKSGLYTLDFDLPDEMPTAFICHCDRAAYFLLEKLKSQNISVPRDISILSFDDTEVAQQTTPPLTSFKIDRNMFSLEAIKIMEKKLENSLSTPERIYLSAELIERESVQAI